MHFELGSANNMSTYEYHDEDYPPYLDRIQKPSGMRKKAAAEGAVYIVRNGTPEYVYITLEHHQCLMIEADARNSAPRTTASDKLITESH
jgi:hypothetical protein